MNLNEWIRAAWHAPFFKLFLLIAVGSALWNWLKKLRAHRLQESAENWPMVQGRVFSREIEERTNDGSIESFIAVLTYSYFHNGRQTGTYKREFDSRDEAEAWIDQLYEKQIPVRFDPARPLRSTLIERELPVLSSASLASSSQPSMFSSRPEEPQQSVWHSLIAAGSLIGLGVCAVCHIEGVIHPDSSSLHNELLFGMQIYTIAPVMVASMLERGTMSRFTSKRQRAEMNAVTPEPLRWLGRLIWIYGLAWFAVTWLRVAIFPSNQTISPLAMFTAFQSIFLFEAYRMTQMARWRREAGSS